MPQRMGTSIDFFTRVKEIVSAHVLVDLLMCACRTVEIATGVRNTAFMTGKPRNQISEGIHQLKSSHHVYAALQSTPFA